MNFNGSELLGNLQSLQSKLADGTSISDLTSMVQLPQLDQFSELASSLLPQNLVQIDIEGVLNMLNPLELQNAIKQGVQQLQGVLTQDIKGVIDQVTSIVGDGQGILNSNLQDIIDTGTNLISNQSSLFNEAINGVTSLTNMSTDIGVLSQYSNAVSSITNTIKNFSPKQIRDLANDPEYYNKIVSETLEKASLALEDEVNRTVKEYVTPPSNISASTSIASSSKSINNASTFVDGKEIIEVKISTFHSKGDGADVDAALNRTATGKKLISGKSCAVDNSKILFNSIVEVPGLGKFNAIDKVRGGGYNIQLYFEKLEDAIFAQRMINNPVLVAVTPPTDALKIEPLAATKRGNAAELI